MSDTTNTTPPEEVLVEFLRLLVGTVEDYEETLVPVLRGSLLLRHWFGEKARPAGDVDLECFEREPAELTDQQRQYREEGVGTWGEFTSLVDFGKAMARYALSSSQYHRWDKSRPTPAIEFSGTQHPNDGDSLWTYGTPGERYYTGWTIHEEAAAGLSGLVQTLFGNGPRKGVLQIDIAEKGAYELDEVGVEPLPLVAPDGSTFDCPAYTREMLLAAKLSWLLRSVGVRGLDRILDEEHDPPRWHGEPKDLFDAHLLVTEGEIDGAELQRCLLAVGREDGLEWNRIENLFDVRRDGFDVADFPDWADFRERYPELVTSGPVTLLAELVDRLEPLLGPFWLPDESAFLLAIDADPIDETNYLPYADWLEERGDVRSEVVRGFVRVAFHEDELNEDELFAERADLRFALRAAPEPWLCRMFGTTARLDALRHRLEAD